MAQEWLENNGGPGAREGQDAAIREEPLAKPSPEQRGEGSKGPGWIVWALIIMVAFLLASSVANLIVSQRAYESSLKQVKAMEQLTQSIKDIQKSVAILSKMIEQYPQEYEEPEEEIEHQAGDGSI